ncbi:collagen binding domain-containing protein [Aneurinibacillus aneurinilyticus]|uniref:collagen binding domain-containing protein n=1 Tax=Aneurinibacillus aneurinilyticus TaxID=1391 RepID=UPI003C6C2116
MGRAFRRFSNCTRRISNRAYNTESIEWNVDFNKYLETINNTLLSDPIQAGQELQAGSIKAYKLITKLDGSTIVGEELTKNSHFSRFSSFRISKLLECLFSVFILYYLFISCKII